MFLKVIIINKKKYYSISQVGFTVWRWLQDKMKKKENTRKNDKCREEKKCAYPNYLLWYIATTWSRYWPDSWATKFSTFWLIDRTFDQWQPSLTPHNSANERPRNPGSLNGLAGHYRILFKDLYPELVEFVCSKFVEYGSTMVVKIHGRTAD